jgi:hypothetical protein
MENSEFPRDRAAIRAYCEAGHRRTIAGEGAKYQADFKKLVYRVAAELSADEFKEWCAICGDEQTKCAQEYKGRVEKFIAVTSSPLYKLVFGVVVVAVGAAVILGIIFLFGQLR